MCSESLFSGLRPLSDLYYKECGKYGALTDFAFLKQYCEPCMVRCLLYLSCYTAMY